MTEKQFNINIFKIIMNMKKILFGMMAVAGLAAVSCESNLEPAVEAGKEVVVSIEVGTPEIATRAFSDGMTATVLQYAVYDEAGNELADLTVENAEIHGKTTVEFKLTTGNKYSMIFWAAAPNAPYEVNFAEQTMTVDYSEAVSNDENRDAFYKYVEPFTVTGPMSKTIELKRPFAQLNIGTNDFEDSEAAGYLPTQSKVTVPVSSSLNLVSGAVNEAVATTFDFADFKRTETFPVKGYEYLAMNYLLVGADKGVVDVEFAYTDGNVEKSRKVGSVPVQRNHRTNLYGQLLTSDVEINVEILPDYDDPDLPETDEEKLIIAAQLGGTVVLSGDVELSAPIEVVAPMTIDLGGHTITTKLEREGRHYYAIMNYSILTIKGEGAINARGVKNFKNMTIEEGVAITNIDTDGGAAVWNEGAVVINGGTFKTNASAGEGSYGAALNTRTGGKAVVNGGVFEAYSQLTYAIINEGISTVINNATVKAKHGCVAGLETSETVINGGSFELMVNPGVSDHCTYFVSSIKGGKFTLGANDDSGAQLFYESKIAEGFEAVVNGGWTYVVPEGAAVASSQTELADALADGETQIVLAAGEYTMPAGSNFTAETVVVCEEGTVFTGMSKLDINGATIIGAEFSNPGGSAADQTINGVFKDCKFTGTDGLRWGTAGKTVVFEGCEFSGSLYGAHFDGGAEDVIFRNCTLSGFNAFGAALTMLTFEGCTFKGNGVSGYNGANLWGSAKLVNCEFTFDGSTANEWIDCIGADKTYEFVNCTVNGVDYTPANFTEYGDIFSRNHVKVTINGTECQL